MTWEVTADMRQDAERAVVRHFQHYSAEHRADRAASHRMGPRQRQAVGEFFYTHPAVPARTYPTRRAAARAGLEAEILAVLVWLRLWLDRFDVIVLHTSAGKDSQTAVRWALALCQLADVMDRVAVLHLVLDRNPGDWHPPLVTWEGPRVEWQEVPELAAAQAARHGITLAGEDGWIVQNAARNGAPLLPIDWAGQMHYARREFTGDLWDDVATRRKRNGSLRGWPTMFTRYCTSDWKTAVGRAFTQTLCDTLSLGRPARVLQVMGFRAEESRDRAARPAFGLNAGVTAPTMRRVWEWLPIHALTLPEVWADIRESGVPYHPAYDEGLSRLSCRFCIMANPRDLATARRMSPDSAAAVIGVEVATGDPFQAKIKKTVRNKVVVSEVKIPLPLAAVAPAPGRAGFDVRWLACPTCAVPVLAEVRETSRACPAHAGAGAWDLLDVPSGPGCTQLDLFVSGWGALAVGAE